MSIFVMIVWISFLTGQTGHGQCLETKNTKSADEIVAYFDRKYPETEHHWVRCERI